MRKETKTYNVYTYDELDEKIQEKLLEKEIEFCINDYCEYLLEEDMSEYAKILLEKYFGQNATFKTVWYDLSYSQGCGAMIQFDLTYYGCDLSIVHRGNYYHEHSFNIEENGEKYLSDNRYKYLHDKIVNMNYELSKYGYDLIDYNNFTEQAKELLKESEYLENGEVF